jgi:hypothetical protein
MIGSSVPKVGGGKRVVRCLHASFQPEEFSMSDTEVNDELTEEVRRKLQQRDEMFREWAERRKRLEHVEARRQVFAKHFGVRPIKWSRHNLMRLLNKTAVPAERMRELRGLLDLLGMNSAAGRHWIGCGSVWDHGEMWSKNAQPCIVVGHPYDVPTGGVSHGFIPHNRSEKEQWSDSPQDRHSRKSVVTGN